MGIRCGQCKLELDDAAFAPSQRRTGAWCRSCFRAYYQRNRADILAYERAKVPPPRTAQCAWCGAEFQTPYTRTRFCNKACKDASHHNARPRVNGAAMARITRGRLAKRDGWTCALCGEPIDPKLTRPNPMSASVDHRIPTSRGGSDDMTNLQLAHLTCNMHKSDRLPTNF